MRKILMAVMCACALVGFSAEKAKLTLAEAREKIAAIVSEPEKMGEVMQQLSAEDQQAFLIEVNKAISAMPGSNESKTAKFLVVEREAFLNAKKGNLQPLVAMMFKSVPVESLTVLSERYGEDLFNRSADATKTFTDEQFTEIASSTVGEVKKECEGLPDAAPRDTLAVYLFEKASNGTIPGLEDQLLEIAISDTQVRKVAKEEWLTAAKGEGNDKFSALLGYADAGRSPNVDVTLRIAGPQLMTAMLNDLAQGVTDSSGRQIMPVTKGENVTGRETATLNQIVQANTAAVATDAATKPKSANPLAPYNPAYNRNQVETVKEEIKKEEQTPEPEPEPEPKPYQWQD